MITMKTYKYKNSSMRTITNRKLEDGMVVEEKYVIFKTITKEPALKIQKILDELQQESDK